MIVLTHCLGRKIKSVLKEPWSDKPFEQGLSEVEYQMQMVSERALTLQNQKSGRIGRDLGNVTTQMDNVNNRTQNTEILIKEIICK